MSYLELKDIHKAYYLGKEAFPVLNGINLTFERGEFVAILGESGGGKSTLMNIIGGLDRQFEGQVLLQGTALDHHQEKQMDQYRRETVGYIYQSYNLINHLSVLDNVLISLDMTKLSRSEREQRAKELLTQVGLADQIKKYPNQLSGGQKQRVAIARALASDPQIIIADEPTGALDSENTAEVLKILDQIAAEGRLVICVTHSQDVANAGTRIVRLADGKITDDERLKPAYPVDENRQQIPARKLPWYVPLSTAFKHLRYTWTWNLIIIIGTAIGLFAVMLFNGLGNGLKGYINQEINDMVNPRVVTVSRYQKSSQSQRGGGQQGNQQAAAMGASVTTTSQPTFSTAQLNQLKKVKHVTTVQPILSASNATITVGSKDYSASSVTTWTASNRQSIIKAGHAAGKDEIVVDKSSIAKKWSSKNWKQLVGKKVTVAFQTTNKSGKSVTVKRQLTVSGITDSTTGSSVNAVTYATMKAMRSAKDLSTQPTSVAVKVDSRNHNDAVTKQINKLKTDGKRAYSATSIASILDTVNTYVNLATTILAAIAGISLLVSALMIIVTMFMSVSARKKEIGILRALGESRRDIRRLFTSESLIIGVISALLATGIAYGIGAVLNKALYQIASYNMIEIQMSNIISTFIIALVIALLAAILPAWRAARLNPIDALAAD
ncbi:ABC transporter ATP-binding protein/permease [Lactiplantibacillus paraplantarum]|uniref:ATP-binding cassette domain-containing protein n=1 Tax=Lactiplantibacillus paraplantarum TaxID=60520 RepID=A0AAD0TQB5_9LACO|nr:ABC transporter ATP-binding protein/permease [Lactiplantibacillus paraplantarum]AVW11229.1 ABC transporter ATP-binding protein [Lactiplantibacillus paraplantarum]AYJ39642.1 ATP-binding cassette domain-containing protein [Lactiplantibacillus paraplantarum]ERL45718.1 ABC superfamily ATP binding cassette transporter, ABC/membrane protein [Lactiplantibacillus paraplantarum]KRL47681.1 ABC superfamily ATP binding cassette transporter, ABC membrane protein [Lactiplantibacillus paraplantarum DSM 106